MNNRFIDKIVVVTGGCRGIGLAIVEKFARAGARVYAVDYQIPGVNEPLFENKELSSKVKVIQADVTSDESVKNAVNTILGDVDRIDVFVNNAGITRDNLLLRMTEEQWDQVIDTNLKGLFICTKNIAKLMMSQRSGKIINIGSVVGVMGNAGQANYSASKAGAIGFTKSVAKELASRNICVNLIAPGYISTPMTDKLTDDQRKAFLEVIPLKRAGTPEDVANVATFLASEEANYITGQVIHVDGGMLM